MIKQKQRIHCRKYLSANHNFVKTNVRLSLNRFNIVHVPIPLEKSGSTAKEKKNYNKQTRNIRTLLILINQF